MHYTGDNSAVIGTDTQKNTVYALARLHGVGPIEEFALRMARHFVDKYPQVSGSRQEVERVPRRPRSCATTRRPRTAGGRGSTASCEWFRPE